MRKNLTLKRGKYDQIILDILRAEKNLPRRKLVEKCLSKGIPESTAYKRINQLINYSFIEYIPHVLKIAERIEEADLDEVQDCMEVIKNEKNENILLARINKLKQISIIKRVAHFPQVRFGIIECLENSKVITNPNIFKGLVLTLAHIIDFEQRNISPDSEKIVEQIVNNTLNRIISIIEEKPELLGYSILFFLGRSGKKEAVDILFKWIKNNRSQATYELENLAFALGKQNLYKKYRKLIDKHLDDLMRNGDETLLQIASKLSEKIISQI